MSGKLYGWAWQQVVPDTHTLAVLLYLVESADKYGATFRGVKTIAAKVKCSERKVKDALKWLDESGLIFRQHRYRGDGTRTTDRISVLGAQDARSSSHDRQAAELGARGSGLGAPQSGLGAPGAPQEPLTYPRTDPSIAPTGVGAEATTESERQAKVEQLFYDVVGENWRAVLGDALRWARSRDAQHPWAYVLGAVRRSEMGAERGLTALIDNYEWGTFYDDEEAAG